MARVMGTPILLERSKSSGSKNTVKKAGGSKKRKPRLKDADRIERHLYRAAERSADAADRGVRRYNKARKSSARRERDGAIIDLMPNMARGMAVTAGRLAPVPLDLVRAGMTPSVRRVTRRSVRATARMLDRS